VNSPFVLAACAEMLCSDRPLSWRLARLTEMGFEVGLWGVLDRPSDDLAMLEKSGARFSSMTGYLRGRLAEAALAAFRAAFTV
jgi:hydroxypyruvate isomerase